MTFQNCIINKITISKLDNLYYLAGLLMFSLKHKYFLCPFSNSIHVYFTDEFFNIVLFDILNFKVITVSKAWSVKAAMRSESFDKQNAIITHMRAVYSITNYIGCQT